MSSAKNVELDDPRLLLNRELSLLEFNRRVLEQAKDERTPVLERLRFLTISSTNLDEFFEIRVAGLKQKVAYALEEVGPDGLSSGEALRRVGETAQGLVAEQYRVLNDELMPLLAKQGIRLIRRKAWNGEQRRWLRRRFRAEILPVLTPIGLDPAHPFPRVLNKGLSFLVALEGEDAFERDSAVAVVQVPRSLPRLISLRSEPSLDFVMLSSVIHEFMDELFPGMEVTGCYQFRVTRNSDLWVDEEEVDNLLQALKGQLPNRKFGDAVRIEVADTCTKEMTAFLLQKVGLQEIDLYRVNGPVNLHRLAAIYEMADRPALKFPPFVPGASKRLMQPDLFEVIRKGDLVLHHPYETFTPIIQLIQQATRDPRVLAIKMTVYRTDENSLVVAALLEAAKAGKEVTVVIELRARFDEAANIDLATQLQEAGANVVYGIVGYKAHAKMLLIMRREGRSIRRYVHLGTGNYHAGTARAYTDVGLLTCTREIGLDVHKVFQELTGLGKVSRLKLLLQSPFTLHRTLLKLIDKEVQQAEEHKPARIVACMNSLSDPSMIQALYRASRAGVQVDLIVRGICCLRPGVPGVSENIRVRSIVGRFLEHARVYYFFAGGDETTYCASADLMPRNLFRRVETAFPILDSRLRSRVISETLELALLDNQQAWILRQDGTYVRVKQGKQRPICSQEVLLDLLSNRSQGAPQIHRIFKAARQRSKQYGRRQDDDANPAEEASRAARKSATRAGARKRASAKAGEKPAAARPGSASQKKKRTIQRPIEPTAPAESPRRGSGGPSRKPAGAAEKRRADARRPSSGDLELN